jgi:hypothetical protein
VAIPFGPSGFPINIFWPIDEGTTRLDWIYYALKDWEAEQCRSCDGHLIAGITLQISSALLLKSFTTTM